MLLQEPALHLRIGLRVHLRSRYRGMAEHIPDIYGVYAHLEKMHLATMTQVVARYPLFVDAGHPLGSSAQVLFQDIRDPLRREGLAVSVREQDLFPSTYPESRGVGANQLLVSPCDGNVPCLASLPVRLDVGASRASTDNGENS